MKNFILLTGLFFSFNFAPAFAENTEVVNLEKDIAKKQKKLIILENLELTPEEQKVFLPVYDEYQEARGKNNEALGRLIVDFAKNYDSLTNEKALTLLNEVLNVKQGRLDIKKNYLGKFAAILPGKKVARYYHIESKLEALAEVELAEAIPLVQ